MPISTYPSTSSGTVQTVVAGTNVTVNSTDPANPIVNATGGGTFDYGLNDVLQNDLFLE
jgi:hypothetical protein